MQPSILPVIPTLRELCVQQIADRFNQGSYDVESFDFCPEVSNLLYNKNKLEFENAEHAISIGRHLNLTHVAPWYKMSLGDLELLSVQNNLQSLKFFNFDLETGEYRNEEGEMIVDAVINKAVNDNSRITLRELQFTFRIDMVRLAAIGEMLPNLTSLHFAEVNEDEFRILCTSFPNLVNLEVMLMPYIGLTHISKLKNLKVLSISLYVCEEDDFMELFDLEHLEVLEIINKRYLEACTMQYFFYTAFLLYEQGKPLFSNLKVLNANFTDFDDIMLRDIPRYFKNLEELHIVDTEAELNGDFQIPGVKIYHSTTFEDLMKALRLYKTGESHSFFAILAILWELFQEELKSENYQELKIEVIGMISERIDLLKYDYFMLSVSNFFVHCSIPFSNLPVHTINKMLEGILRNGGTDRLHINYWFYFYNTADEEDLSSRKVNLTMLLELGLIFLPDLEYRFSEFLQEMFRVFKQIEFHGYFAKSEELITKLIQKEMRSEDQKLLREQFIKEVCKKIGTFFDVGSTLIEVGAVSVFLEGLNFNEPTDEIYNKMDLLNYMRQVNADDDPIQKTIFFVPELVNKFYDIIPKKETDRCKYLAYCWLAIYLEFYDNERLMEIFNRWRRITRLDKALKDYIDEEQRRIDFYNKYIAWDGIHNNDEPPKKLRRLTN